MASPRPESRPLFVIVYIFSEWNARGAAARGLKSRLGYFEFTARLRPTKTPPARQRSKLGKNSQSAVK